MDREWATDRIIAIQEKVIRWDEWEEWEDDWEPFRLRRDLRDLLAIVDALQAEIRGMWEAHDQGKLGAEPERIRDARWEGAMIGAVVFGAILVLVQWG